MVGSQCESYAALSGALAEVIAELFPQVVPTQRENNYSARLTASIGGEFGDLVCAAAFSIADSLRVEPQAVAVSICEAIEKRQLKGSPATLLSDLGLIARAERGFINFQILRTPANNPYYASQHASTSSDQAPARPKEVIILLAKQAPAIAMLRAVAWASILQRILSSLQIPSTFNSNCTLLKELLDMQDPALIISSLQAKFFSQTEILSAHELVETVASQIPRRAAGADVIIYCAPGAIAEQQLRTSCAALHQQASCADIVVVNPSREWLGMRINKRDSAMSDAGLISVLGEHSSPEQSANLLLYAATKETADRLDWGVPALIESANLRQWYHFTLARAARLGLVEVAGESEGLNNIELEDQSTTQGVPEYLHNDLRVCWLVPLLFGLLEQDLIERGEVGEFLGQIAKVLHSINRLLNDPTCRILIESQGSQSELWNILAVVCNLISSRITVRVAFSPGGES